MRMSCNSTYLLDQETDHGVKADELAALFDDLFAEPEAKAVVFSQWTRTHDIVIRRLEARDLGYVSFHGGVPSDKRPALVERFRDDPTCRVFLSTDAGSTGLNLQHASTLVNMDLPWNPAILEQRIARIHRMGQKRPVRVINFVAKGTIEEGMLSVLAFKRSLSAGILDGGSGEISLGGSRLSRFRVSVARRRYRRRTDADRFFRLQRAGVERKPADQDKADEIDRNGLRQGRRPSHEIPDRGGLAGFIFHAIVLLEIVSDGKPVCGQGTAGCCRSRPSASRAARLSAEVTIRTRLPMVSISKPNANGATACAIRAGAPMMPRR